ncbi:hypothetical protein F4677DRAFT_459094 [Hypoxylon crocopeplum]|nr:hypothetical protein F4677DRAFT_459094 [Hypoxylon crocopeplum]
MNFGFGVGDFITVIKLVNKVRKEFAGAPSQFREVSDEVRGLSIVLQDVEIDVSEHELDEKQKSNLQNITNSCRSVLDDLEVALDKYRELESRQKGIDKAARRAWKRLTWEPNDIRDLRHRITSNTVLLSSFSQQCSSRHIVKLVRNQDDHERRAILDWLTPYDYAPQQADLISRRQPDTGQWLLGSPEYQTWVETKKQTLFCPGIPGAGKTIIASIVIDSLSARFEDDSSVGIAYIYCNFRRQAEQTTEDLSMSLLKQLAQSRQSLPDAVKDLHNQHRRMETRPSANEISSALKLVASLYSRVFIVVDALDECQTSGGCRTKLLLEVFDLQKQDGTNILATSRFIPEILSEFTTSTSLEIRATKEDVRRYLKGHMEQLPPFVLRNSKVIEDIINIISEAADGMFLLALLYFGSLDDKPTIRAIKAALRDFQKHSGQSSGDKIQILTDAYEKAMERVNGQKQGLKDLGIQVLSWITCARRTLSTLELQHALAVEIGEEELDEDNIPDIDLMVSVCAGLVTIDEESGIVRLVHYTAQEYFDKTQSQWFSEAQLAMTRTCSTYLSLQYFASGQSETDEKFEQRLRLHPFYDYAAHNWGHHARVAPEYEEHLNYSQRFPEKVSGLHLVAYFDLEEYVDYILSEFELEVRDGVGQTPLTWAAEHGHVAVARRLLEKGANIEAKDIVGCTPLYEAAYMGREAVVLLLLDNGASMEIVTKDDGWVPLLVASFYGHENIVRLLLEKGADIEVRGRDSGWTPLILAACQGREATVQLLLEKGANIEAKDWEGSDTSTPLEMARFWGHEAVVQILLEKGADTTHLCQL